MPQSSGLKPPFNDDELAGIIGNQIDLAQDFGQDFLEENRRQAWNYYLGRRQDGKDFSATTDREGFTRTGRSEAVSEDVSDMVEALMATLMPGFGSDVPAEFEPLGPDDEENAYAESDAVANVLMEQNNGWVVLAEAVKDALLLRNGTIKCWIEETTEVERKRFDDIDDLDLAQLLAAVPEDIEAVVTLRKGNRANVRFTAVNRVPRVAAIQQAHFLIDPNHDSIFIQDTGFCAERKFPKRSDLIAEGLPKSKVDKLGAFHTDTDVDSTAKNIEAQSQQHDAPTHDQDVIEVFEVYMRIDMDGDGVSELMRFIWSNRVVLDKEEAQFIPYATGTGWLVPHRYSGLSVYDKIAQITDIKSRALSQYLDNLTTNNSAKTAVNENTINLDDLLTGRPNAIVRNDGPPGDDIMPFPTNDTGASSQALLDYMDRVRDQRAGAALSLQQPQEQLVKAGVSAQAVDRQMAAGEQMAAMIARTLGETLIRTTFILIHEVLRTQFPEPIMLNRSGQWVQVSPQEWPPRNRVNIKVGLSPAERSRKANALQTTIQQQIGIFQQGGQDIIVDLNGIHRAILDWSRAVDLDNAEKYWVDPESPASQQAQQGLQEKRDETEQQQLAAVTAEAAALSKNSDQDFIVDQMKIQFDYFNAVLDAETEEAKIIAKATEQLQELQLEGARRSNGTGQAETD